MYEGLPTPTPTGPWAKYRRDAPPASPPPPQVPERIYGAPSPTGALDQQYKAGQIQSQQRDAALAPLQQQALKAQIENRSDQQANYHIQQSSQIRDDYNNQPEVKAYNLSIPVYASALESKADPAGDLNLIYAYAKVMDPTSVVREGEQASVAGGDTWVNQRVAELKKQLGGGGTFGPEYRNSLIEEMRNRLNQQNRAFSLQRDRYRQLATRNGLNPEDVIGPYPGAAYEQIDRDYWKSRGNQIEGDPPALQVGPASAGSPPTGGAPTDPGARPMLGPDEQVHFNGDEKPLIGLRLSNDQQSQMAAAIHAGDAGQVQALAQRFGINVPPGNVAQLIQYAAKHPDWSPVFNYSQPDQVAATAAERARDGDHLAEAMDARKDAGSDVVARGLANTYTLGLANHAEAGLDALLHGRSYTDAIQRQHAIDDADSRLHPRLQLGGEIAGAVLNPYGRAATTPLQLAKVGALSGATYSVLDGNSLADAPGNALRGAAAGGLAGGVLGKAAQSLPGAYQATRSALSGVADRLSPGRVAARDSRAAFMGEAQDVAAAAQTEGVPVSRAILDPGVRNQVTALETNPGSGQIIREGLNATRDGLSQGLDRLAPGTARDNFDAGSIIQNAGKRFIDKTGARANALYGRAREAAGDVKTPAADALAAIDANIAELSQLPKANAPLIGYMHDLRADMSKGLSIDALRNLRSQMRGQVNTRNLTASDAERRVRGVLDAASGDISKALEGNPEASQAYAAADKFYREKQDYIKDVVQKFIGPRDTPMAPEQALTKFQNMAKMGGDSTRMAEMMRSVSPEEAGDLAATFAHQLGRNAAGDFTAAQLVSQAEKLSERAKLTIFGPQGAQSLNNLVKVARQLKATEGNLNHSRTGVAQNYRNWLGDVMGLGSGGLTAIMSGSATTGGVAGFAVKGLIDAGQKMSEKMTARALVSPEITKWLASAPRTVTPALIDQHYNKLARIGALNPGLRDVVAEIERRLVASVSQQPRLAADEPDQPRKPVQ